jgi:MoxR-like ATPase
MQEHAVTVARKRHVLPEPFMVLATQNPLEMEGTYPLPEAQLDRFLFKTLVGSPERDELVGILDRTTGTAAPTVQPVITGQRVLQMQQAVRGVLVASHIKQYIASLVLATHPRQPSSPPEAKKFVRYGASPRGGQAILLAAKVLALRDGRANVSLEDVQAAAAPALRHRLILSFEGQAEGIDADAVIAKVLAAVSA